jgi:hypothetical protein
MDLAAESLFGGVWTENYHKWIDSQVIKSFHDFVGERDCNQFLPTMNATDFSSPSKVNSNMGNISRMI